MKVYTLGFLFRNKKIILAKKKRKIGVGKWNGYGGKVEEGEDRSSSLVREIKEECGVSVDENSCIELGCIDFIFKDEDKLKVFIYRIDDFLGEPKETGEMGKPEEFPVDKIPYNEMMVGDDRFIPFVIDRKKFRGKICFSENGEELLKCVLVKIADKTRKSK